MGRELIANGEGRRSCIMQALRVRDASSGKLGRVTG